MRRMFSPDHRADFACQILFDDGMGHVPLNSSPGGEFGCEMCPSSGVFDNI